MFTKLIIFLSLGLRVKRGYPAVTIENRTGYLARGTVNYASLFCSDEFVEIAPYAKYEGSSRGICLLCGISLELCKKDGSCKSTEAYSLDVCTSYHEFEVTHNVVRRIK